jgi:uncharacterized RDD family membrane protein YckC
VDAGAAQLSDARDEPGPSATFTQRLVAFVIDNVLYLGSVLALSFALRTVSTVLAAAVYAAGLVGQLGYFAAFEGSGSGQTPGKRMLRIRVADRATGGSIGVVRALYRAFAKNLSLLPFTLGYLWMLWDRRSQTWHDKLCDSIVVSGPRPPAATGCPGPPRAARALPRNPGDPRRSPRPPRR